MNRLLWVAVSVVALAAGAAVPRHVVIKKKSGERLEGNIVSELESGYLLKLDKGGTVKVSFEEIADLNEPGAKAPAAKPAEVPSPPPEPPLQAAPSYPNEGPCGPNESYVTLPPGDDHVWRRLCADRTEVTVEKFKACVDAGYCRADGEMQCGGAANWGRPDRLDHPINCVTAMQAEVFCGWKKARLPTEDEVKDLDGTGSFPWGEADPTGRVCWSGDEPRTTTCKVGAYPTGVGFARIYDLAGNVWEWTSSEKRGDRIYMGGAWNSKHNGAAKSGSWKKADPTTQSDDLGFRCVRTVR